MKKDEVKKFLSSLQIYPTRSLGQNFLVNEKTVERIVAAAELTGKETVLEIGPGLGMLTSALLQKSQEVVAIEYEKKFVEFLKRVFADKKHIHILHGDVRTFLRKKVFPIKTQDYVLVTNLPYHITGYFFEHIFSMKHPPKKIIIMIQKEVAERIFAKPPKMALAGFFVSWYAKGKFLFRVHKELFWPMPKVESAVISLDLYQNPLEFWSQKVGFQLNEEDEKKIFQLVRLGFSQKRKQLVGLLCPKKDDRERVKMALQKIGKIETSRAQEFKVEDWIVLQKVLQKDLT